MAMQSTNGALKWVTILGAALCIYMAVHGGAADLLKTGAKAPMIEGKNQDGKSWKLSNALRKHVVLLYFYPKDDTPGCTKQACGLRDRLGDLKKQGVEVVGVSRDSEASHKAFIAKHQLNFDLLADTDGSITQAYGAKMPEKEMSRRVSFLIGRDGQILHITDNRDAAVHLTEMQEAVAKLKGSNFALLGYRSIRLGLDTRTLQCRFLQRQSL